VAAARHWVRLFKKKKKNELIEKEFHDTENVHPVAALRIYCLYILSRALTKLGGGGGVGFGALMDLWWRRSMMQMSAMTLMCSRAHVAKWGGGSCNHGSSPIARS